VNLFLALKKSLQLLLGEGMENVWERHRKVSADLQCSLLDLGIKLFIMDESFRLPTVTAGMLPDPYRSEDLQRFLQSNFGILIAGGVGPLRERLFRIGHMGYSARSLLVNRVVAAITRFMK
jgi:aspartate aminotransferase-like enzyme